MVDDLWWPPSYIAGLNWEGTCSSAASRTSLLTVQSLVSWSQGDGGWGRSHFPVQAPESRSEAIGWGEEEKSETRILWKHVLIHCSDVLCCYFRVWLLINPVFSMMVVYFCIGWLFYFEFRIFVFHMGQAGHLGAIAFCSLPQCIGCFPDTIIRNKACGFKSFKEQIVMGSTKASHTWLNCRMFCSDVWISQLTTLQN